MDSIEVSLASTVHGSLGLRSLSLLSSSACISLLSVPLVLLILKTYTCCWSKDIHLTNAIDHFYYHVSPIEKLSVKSIFSSPVSQRLLSSKVNDHCFQNFFDRSSRASKAIGCYQFQHLMPPVIPSTSQRLHLDPIEFRVAVNWWLGLDTSQGSQCAFCPAHSLDPLWTPRFSMQMWGWCCITP